MINTEDVTECFSHVSSIRTAFSLSNLINVLSLLSSPVGITKDHGNCR